MDTHEHYLSRGFRMHPLACTFMALWGVLGLSLIVDRWGLNMWPGVLVANRSEEFAYFVASGLMATASALYLTGALLVRRWRHAAFTRWMGLWIGLFSAVHVLAGIAVLVVQGREVYPQWIVAGVFWLIAFVGFFFALVLTHRSEFPKVVSCE